MERDIAQLLVKDEEMRAAAAFLREIDNQVMDTYEKHQVVDETACISSQSSMHYIN